MKNNGLTREESIRLEAYLLSEKAGHPTGMEQFFWKQAEALVQKRSTTAMPVAKTAAATKSRTKKQRPAAVTLVSSTPPKKKSTAKAVIAPEAAERPKPATVVAATKKRVAPVKKARALPAAK